jgi:3',5'-cyclic AMP phosphodiesterase CpdA
MTAAIMRAMALLSLLLALSGCLQVADNRARRDQRIGQASAAGITVAVDEGLGHVRELGPGVLRLWAQAPALALAVTRDAAAAAAPLAITLDNVLADAQLLDEAGQPLAAYPGDEPFATRRRFLLPAGPGSHRLTLRPADADRRERFRIGVFADVQERIDDVGDIYARMNQDPSIRFILMSGDLTSRGTYKQLERFQREMRALSVPIYATLGNHELGSGDEYFHNFFGRGNFSFDFRGARFTLLDSASATLSPLTYDMLDGWLRAGQDRFHFVGMHIPPLDPVGLRGGGFASHLEASSLLARLAAMGVNLTIYGHVHSYYAFSNAGIAAHITGGGGAIPERLDGIGRHFLTVDVDPDTQLFQVGIVRVD